jgi:hypothetical protein
MEVGSAVSTTNSFERLSKGLLFKYCTFNVSIGFDVFVDTEIPEDPI